MESANPHYTESQAIWEAYYGPNAFCRQGRPRRYGDPAPPPFHLPSRPRWAKQAGRVDPRLSILKRRNKLIAADTLEAERRCERRSLEREFQYAADGTRLLLNRNGSRVLLKGQAVPFGSVSEKVDGHYEKFKRGALTWAQGCALVVGHGGPEIANTASGTLRIWNDEGGLKFSAVLAETPAGRAAVNSARLATGASITFVKMEQARIGRVVEVSKAVLRYIAIIEPPKRPAYPMSWVSVNSEPPP